jgi:hypothetical protein
MGVGHLARYAAGAVLSWLIFPIEAALIYVALVVAAVLFDQDLGGPLAGPMMIVLAAVLGAGVTVLVALPAILVGDLIARRTRWFAAPLAAALGALVLLAAYVWGWGLAVHSSISDTAIAWGLVAALSLLPLLTFGVLTYSSGALLALVARRRNA